MEKTNKVLALYPNTRCIGHVTLDWPENLIDYGTFSASPLCNERLLRGVKKTIEYFKPELVLIRDCETKTLRGKRAQHLMEMVECYAKEIGVPIYKYTRQQVRDVFDQFQAKTKYDIMKKLVAWYPELKWREPKIREVWDDESANMAVFDAIALAITHKYLTE